MANMGKYCKAYPAISFREFDGWTENSLESQEELTDDSILYLQENFAVTHGIFLDEEVIFDQVTPEWMAFCRTTLGFEVPAEEATA
jgi:hypothetical protein